MRRLIAKVTKEGPAAKDTRRPACCVTVRRESVAKAILKKAKPAKAKHGVAKASRKGPRKQVHRTLFTQVFGTAQLVPTHLKGPLVSDLVHFNSDELSGPFRVPRRSFDSLNRKAKVNRPVTSSFPGTYPYNPFIKLGPVSSFCFSWGQKAK